MRLKRALAVIGLLLLAVTILPRMRSSAVQPEGCDALFGEAVSQFGRSCAGTPSDSACYGFPTGDIVPVDADLDLPFAAPGDILTLQDIQSVLTQPLDLE